MIWYGEEFTYEPVEILGESDCRECVVAWQAREATWRDEVELGLEARSGL